MKIGLGGKLVTDGACQRTPIRSSAVAWLILFGCHGMAQCMADSLLRRLSKRASWPNIFCVALSMPFGYEPELLAAQFTKGLSAFGCDAFQVFSNASFSKEYSMLNVTALQGSLRSPVGGKYRNYLNAPVFAKMWDAIFAEGRFRKFDWLIKVDADAVLFPERMRPILASACSTYPCEPLAFSSCSPTSMAPGSLEILSKAAVERLAGDIGRCRSNFTMKREEDIFLSECLEFLGVRLVSRPDHLEDMDCGSEQSKWWMRTFWEDLRIAPFMACDCCHAAFHPFKAVDDWFACHSYASGAVLSITQKELFIMLLVAACVVAVCCKLLARKRSEGKRRVTRLENETNNAPME